METFNIKGVVAPVFTPIDKNGCVNFEVIPEYMEYLYSNDVHCVLVGGTTGEAVTFNVYDRIVILELWAAAAKPLNVQIIFQVGGGPIADVLKLAERAEELCVDAIMTLPELYYKPKNAEQLVQYLELVSKAAPSLPVLYYHFPMMSGVDVDVREFFALASSKIPNFVGMKADLPVAMQVADQLTGNQRIFIGNHFLAPAVEKGFEDSIATVTNLFPKLVQDIVELAKSSQEGMAKELQETLNRLVDGIKSQGEFVPAMKYAMRLVTGVEVGPPRKPQTPLNEVQKKCLEENLKNLEVPIFK